MFYLILFLNYKWHEHDFPQFTTLYFYLNFLTCFLDVKRAHVRAKEDVWSLHSIQLNILSSYKLSILNK